jgi:hypothetical protein
VEKLGAWQQKVVSDAMQGGHDFWSLLAGSKLIATIPKPCLMEISTGYGRPVMTLQSCSTVSFHQWNSRYVEYG